MARRHSAKRSETPSVWPPALPGPQGAVTSSSASGPNICTRASRALRQAWDQDDAIKASGSCVNLVRRLEHEEPGSSPRAASGGAGETHSSSRLGAARTPALVLPAPTSSRTRSARCVSVTRNAIRWRHAEMALRWTRRRPAGGPENLPTPGKGLSPAAHPPNALEHLRKAQADSAIETIMKAERHINQRRLPHEFQRVGTSPS